MIGKNTDYIIIASLTLVWLALSIRGKAKFVVSTIYAVLTIIGAAGGLNLVLEITALLSFPLIMSVVIYRRIAFKNFLNSYTHLFGKCLALIGITISITGIIITLGPLYGFKETLEARNFAYEIFVFFSSFSAVFLLLVTVSLPLKILMNRFVSALKMEKWYDISLVAHDSIIKRRTRVVFILAFAILSVVMVLIPHHAAINSNDQQIGVDTLYYVQWVNELVKTKDPQEFITQAFVTQQHGDRPLTLILLYSIAKIIHSDDFFYVIEYLPVILGPGLVLVVYFLTRELTSNDIASILASFLTAISFQTLIGIYAGFYANWLALIIGYLSFYFLIKFLKKPGKLNFTLFSTLMVILVFTHVYTWSIFAIAIGIFLAIMLKMDYYHRRSIILVLIVLFSSVVVDIARMTVTGSSSGIGFDIKLADVTLGPEHFALRWANLIDTTENYYGTQFGNSVIFALCLYWLFHSYLRQESTIFILIFLSLSIVPLLFGNWQVQSRVLYNIPFQIPAGIALSYISKQRDGGIILLAICLWLLAISIRSVSNFHFVLPH
jgi:hypothetical protein